MQKISLLPKYKKLIFWGVFPHAVTRANAAHLKLKQCFSLHKDTTPPQPNHTVTPTHIEPEQYTHTQSQAPEDGCTNIRNMLSSK